MCIIEYIFWMYHKDNRLCFYGDRRNVCVWGLKFTKTIDSVFTVIVEMFVCGDSNFKGNPNLEYKGVVFYVSLDYCSLCVHNIMCVCIYIL